MTLSVADKFEVVETKYRYAQTLDAREWDGYRALLADELVIDFRGLGYRGSGSVRTADWWMTQVMGLIPGFDVTQHVMSTPVVDDLGDGEVALTMYLVASHRLHRDDPDDRTFTIGARYSDRLRREGERWVFTELVLDRLWTSGPESIMKEAFQRNAAAT